MNNTETYDVYAVRYATMQNRRRRDNFIADPHDGPMPIDYFVWAIVNNNRTIIVDTGFEHVEAGNRGRQLIRLPREGLALLGIESHSVEDVIITHMHYDHAGTLDDFPNARFHIQEQELSFVTGRYMCHNALRHGYSVGHVTGLIERLYADRVVFHDGDEVLAPGISVHHIGGHTRGLQCVRVNTRRGWVVLASDASHFYENMEKGSPFPIVFNVGDMLQGHVKLQRLAESPKHIVPGHDPLVMERYPAPDSELEGIVIRLDTDPTQ